MLPENDPREPLKLPTRGTRRGKWQIFPIEYKRSRDKAGSIAYRLQLCAQAMCLEEMLSTVVPEAAIYDGKTHRRQHVELLPPLRREVERMAALMHELHRMGRTPAAVLKPACRGCSLVDLCLPAALETLPRIATHIHRMSRASE